jgi:type II secretory pathway component PulM
MEEEAHKFHYDPFKKATIEVIHNSAALFSIKKQRLGWRGENISIVLFSFVFSIFD